MNFDLEELWDNFWRDKRGNIVIWQTPNIALIGWLVLTIVSLFLSGKLSDVFSWAALVSLVIWSLLEITKGVNYFRRLLGLVVLALAVLSAVHFI
jgi:hypothetical protein